MPRKPKEHRNISFKLASDIAAQLDDLCLQTGLSKTAAVERAIQQYVDNFKKTGKI